MPVTTDQHPHIEVVTLDQLHPNPNNARKHNRKSRRAVAISIRRFGFVTPIVATCEGMILAGTAATKRRRTKASRRCR